MKGIDRGVLLLLPFVMVPVGLQAGTIVTATGNDDTEIDYQQVSGSQSAACYSTGQWGISSASGNVSTGSLSAWSSTYGLRTDTFAATDASWDVVFPAAELLTWQIGWGMEADYSMTLDMAGQYAPLNQWIFPENPGGAVWSQIVPAGEWTFSAYTQDYGEGSASLSAALIAMSPVPDPDPPDPVPEPGTWILAGGVFAGLGLLAAARFLGLRCRVTRG